MSPTDTHDDVLQFALRALEANSTEEDRKIAREGIWEVRKFISESLRGEVTKRVVNHVSLPIDTTSFLSEFTIADLATDEFGVYTEQHYDFALALIAKIVPLSIEPAAWIQTRGFLTSQDVVSPYAYARKTDWQRAFYQPLHTVIKFAAAPTFNVEELTPKSKCDSAITKWYPDKDAIIQLKRFHNTSDDSEGYDISNTSITRLVEIGLIYKQHTKYYVTHYGYSVLAGEN